MSEKHERRREQLAESALVTLGERGYAHTSLRDIANNSEFTHGIMHYYFADKQELVIYAVRHYKASCVTRYDGVVEDSRTPDELLDAFAAKLVETLSQEAPMHRLWYDLRTQSMFEPALREAVTMIDGTLEEMVWRVVSRYAELADAPLAVTPHAAYGILDGVFQQALLDHVNGRGDATGGLREQVRALMPHLLEAAAVGAP